MVILMKYDFEEKNKKFTTKKIVKAVIIWLVEIALVIGLAFCIIHFAVEKTKVVGSSMDETLKDGDEVIIDKLSYHFNNPKRFDVIVYKQSNKEHSYYKFKRVIGLPGETVQIKDGVIYINGEVLEEKINVEPMNNAGLASEEVTLDENEYFVLGDNRNNSEDSRFANVGNIIRDEIVGKAWIKLHPFNFVSQLSTKTKDDTKDKVEGNTP